MAIASDGDGDGAADAPGFMATLLDAVAAGDGLLSAASTQPHEELQVSRADELWREKHKQDGGTMELLDLGFSVDAIDYEYGDSEDISTPTGSKRALYASGGSAGPTTRKMKKRRHHEVLRMREAAAELERQLKTLKCQQKQAEAELLRYEGEESDARKWQRIVKKEMQAAARARLENAKLREKLKAQAEFATSLQEALSKRQCITDEAQEQHEQGSHALAIGRASAKEIEIYEQLIKSINARTCDQEVAFQMSRFTDMNNTNAIQLQDTMSDSKILRNEDQALCIDMIERYIIPFDFQAGAKVLWTYVLSRILTLTNQKTQTEVIKSTNDLIVTKQMASSNLMIVDHQFTTEYSVTKRICCSNSVDFLWESIAESTGSISPCTPAIQLVQKGWGKIMRVETVNGSSAASVTAYTRLTPSVVDAESFASHAKYHGDQQQQQSQRLNLRREFDVGRLAAHIISGYRQYSTSVRRHMENTLMDEMLNGAKLRQCQR